MWKYDSSDSDGDHNSEDEYANQTNDEECEDEKLLAKGFDLNLVNELKENWASSADYRVWMAIGDGTYYYIFAAGGLPICNEAYASFEDKLAALHTTGCNGVYLCHFFHDGPKWLGTFSGFKELITSHMFW